MAEEEHRLHRHISRGEQITGPNPELDTALEAKGSYVAFNGEITPFHFWMSEPYPYQHPGTDHVDVAFELFCLPEFEYRATFYQVDRASALHSGCKFARLMHEGKAGILLDEKGRRMDWPQPGVADTYPDTKAELELFNDGLYRHEAPNRIIVAYDLRARRLVDGEAFDCPIRVARHRVLDKPGMVAVKVHCRDIFTCPRTYRRTSEAEALADCHQVLLNWAERYRVTFETRDGAPFLLPSPQHLHPSYPDSGTEEGRAAIRARLSEFVDSEVNALWDSRKKNTEDAQKAKNGKRPATEPKQ